MYLLLVLINSCQPCISQTPHQDTDSLPLRGNKIARHIVTFRLMGPNPAHLTHGIGRSLDFAGTAHTSKVSWTQHQVMR